MMKFLGFDGEEFTDNCGFMVGRFIDTKELIPSYTHQLV